VTYRGKDSGLGLGERGIGGLGESETRDWEKVISGDKGEIGLGTG